DGGLFADIRAELPGVQYGTAIWGDCDNDGDLDCCLAGRTASTERIARVYRNDGDGFEDLQAGLAGVDRAALAWGDHDGDGDLDLFLLGAAAGGDLACLYRNNCTVANSPPDVPGNLMGILGINTLILNWEAATDNETPTTGLTYNLRVGTTPGGSEFLSAQALPGTGYRLVAEPGNVEHNLTWTVNSPILAGLDSVYCSVQAIDAAYTGSLFSTEIMVHRDPTTVSEPEAPRRFALHGNRPNPFNPVTTIVFDLPGTREVDLTIYDAMGRRVRRLIQERMPAGRHAVKWDGRSDQGRTVASGVYFYRLQAEEFNESRRMTLVR
ncbi:MAG: FlgD immunoglobulin-like domain containing protein, partial [bacterium]